MSIQVRAATLADAETIGRFNTLMARETEGIELDPGVVRKGVQGLFEDRSRGRYFMAEREGEVVGQLLITCEWSDWRNGDFWWIQSVYVKKKARKKGAFKALYRHVHRLAESRDDVCGLRLYVEEHNARAKEAYSRLGMERARYDLFELEFDPLPHGK